MKTKRTVVLLALMAFLALPATVVQASSWNLSAGLQDGYWLETFGGGVEGTGGGSLLAEGIGAVTQWSLMSGQVGSAVSQGSGLDEHGSYSQWQSQYASPGSPSSLHLYDESLFGLPDGATFILISAVNTSRHYGDGSLWFEFVASGNYDLYNCTLVATWYGMPIDLGVGHASFSAQHYGDNIGFESLTLEITAVPLPGAALLLASGLVGLAGSRIRSRKL